MDPKIVQDVLDALTAGMQAGKDAVPEHMVVVDTQSNQTWNVPDGPCGFA